MRAPLPCLLSLLLAASPAAANRAVKPVTGRGSTAGGAAGTAGGVSLVTGLNTGLAPSAGMTLAPALAPSPRLSAPTPPATRAPADVAAARPAAAPADAPRAPTARPRFLRVILAAGAPTPLVERLEALLAGGHPGDQNAVYHGLGHSQGVADLTARLAEEAGLTADRTVLVVLAAALHDLDPARAPGMPPTVKATVRHLENDPAARALVSEFGALFGFTPAQVAALIKATDFSPLPQRRQEIEEEFQSSAGTAFSMDRDWALDWGHRIALADKTAAYVGDQRTALFYVRGLATEFAAAAAATGGTAGALAPEAVVANTHNFMRPLRESPDFARLPADLQARFDATLAYFTGLADKDAAAAALRSLDAAPTRGPPVAPRVILDMAAVNRYISSIAGGVQLKDPQRAALFEQWLEEKGIPAGSERALAVKRELLPAIAAADAAALAGVSPRLARHHASLLRLAREQRTTPLAISRTLEAAGTLGTLAGLGAEAFENQAWLAMRRASLERAVSRYPANDQGALMRQIVTAMAAPGGKSVEEVAREGVFAQVNFTSDGVAATADRNPDNITVEMVFYVTRREERWRIEGYRRNRGSGSDAAAKDRLVRWLIAGGVPAADFE